MKQGYIKLYRQLQDCWIWNSKEKHNKRSAWIDLLLLANHSDKKILFDGELITIKRGQYLTSLHKLSDRWGWSINTVKNFLNLLESDEMIHRKSDNRCTLIDIVNYENFQGFTENHSTPTDTVSDTVTDTHADTVTAHSLIPNNNDNNDNNVKNKKERFSPPSLDEVKAYCEERHNNIDPETFIAFYASKGWKIGKNPMKDWKSAVITWEKRDRKPQAEPPKNSKLSELERMYLEE